ncbi:MAG TPA: glycolate oxidase subunit GlcF, partial [Woeseiaceae bacterium]
QTQFTEQQRENADIAQSESVIRRCVHCGFCTATCPTYVLLGDELDSPRGRIYLIKDMLERGTKPAPGVVRHIDRCLSCMACMTTCPSDVNYMHLVDHARVYIENNYQRPWRDRFWRWLLAAVLPYRGRFAIALFFGRLLKPATQLLQSIRLLQPAVAMLRLVPPSRRPVQVQQSAEPLSNIRGKVILLEGCAEPVLTPQIRASAIRLLNRAGYEVVRVPGEVCCGSLVHHMGKEKESHAAAQRMVDLWHKTMEKSEISAVVTTVSGCGTTLKNYGFMLRNNPDYAERAQHVSSKVRDIAEFLVEAGLPEVIESRKPSVAYHAPCSLQHAQKADQAPRQLLEAAGFELREIAEGHLCCGSAGVYNILQQELAGQLRDRKILNVDATGAEVVATSNIGCIMQLAHGRQKPVLHVVELLDWATGGPELTELERC